MFKDLSIEVKAHSAKSEGSKHVDSSSKSISSVSPCNSIKHSASVGIPDSAAAEDIAEMALSSFIIPSYKHKNVITVNPAKCDEKTRVRCLVRRMGPVKLEHYSKLVLLLWNCVG